MSGEHDPLQNDAIRTDVQHRSGGDEVLSAFGVTTEDQHRTWWEHDRREYRCDEGALGGHETLHLGSHCYYKLCTQSDTLNLSPLVCCEKSGFASNRR